MKKQKPPGPPVCDHVSAHKFSAKGHPCGRKASRYWWAPDGAMTKRCRSHTPDGFHRPATEEEKLVWEILSS